MPTRIAYLLLATSLLAGCRTGRNYPDTTGPRYAGGPAGTSVQSARGETIHVVSFNIAFGRRSDSAIKLFKLDPALRNADIVLLQEMDAPSTRLVAIALGFWYVYYPAIFSPRTQRDFGNAVLSRWPTECGPHTTTGGRWDHIFFKGLTAPVAAAGTVSRVRGASDHRPVWAIAVLGQQATRRSLTSSTQNH